MSCATPSSASAASVPGRPPDPQRSRWSIASCLLSIRCRMERENRHEASECSTRIPPLADRRDRAGFHAGGCLGSSGARRRRGLPGDARRHHLPRPGPRGVCGDSRAVRGARADRPVVRLGWWRRTPDSGPDETSLAERLPDDLRGTAAGLKMGSSSRRCIAPAPSSPRNCRIRRCTACCTWPGSIAATAATRDRWPSTSSRAAGSKQYMAFIAPFRHWVVYPALLRQIERAWQAR